MSQEADYSVSRTLPPPPPPPQTSHYQAPQISPLRRLAVQPPRLRTALAPQHAPHGQLHTPASASPPNLSVPYSPYVPSSPAAYAPSPLPPPSPMAMRNTSTPYNPQQWGRSTGSTSGQYAPRTPGQTIARPQEVTGMEGQSQSLVKLKMTASTMWYAKCA
jgi:hypothetical protein